jgi:hypothetical protein
MEAGKPAGGEQSQLESLYDVLTCQSTYVSAIGHGNLSCGQSDTYQLIAPPVQAFQALPDDSLTTKPRLPEEGDPPEGAGTTEAGATSEVGAGAATDALLEEGTGTAAVGAGACWEVTRSEGSTIGPLPGLSQMVEAGS